MKKIIIVLILILAFGSNLTLHAQSPRGTVGIGALIGGARLSGDIEKSNIGLAGGLMLRLSPRPFLAFTVQTSYGQMTTGLNAFKTDVLNASLAGTLFLIPAKKFSPFLNLGYASFHFVARDGGNNQLLRPDGSPVAGWVGAIQTGFGFEFFVAEAWTLNTSIDYFFSNGDELDGIKQGKNDGFFKGLIGFVHYFKKRTKIKDGENFTKAWRSVLENSEVEELPTKQEGSLEPKLDFPAESISTLINEDADDVEAEKEPALTPSTQESQNKIPEEPVDSKERKEDNLTAQQNEEAEPSGIAFEPGSAKILEESIPQLKQIYDYLIENPDAVIEMRGFIENSGNGEFDKKLALERAKAVKTYLVNLGIEPSRIIIIKAE